MDIPRKEQRGPSGPRPAAAPWWVPGRARRADVLLGEAGDLYHHHYGLGPYDPAVLDEPPETRDDRVLDELHRLETAQADALLDRLGDIRPEDRLLDAGSGRGGTSFMAHERFGCRVDGVSLSDHQVDFSNHQSRERGCRGQVCFHHRNMLNTGFPDGYFRAAWTNETTMYVDLAALFREFARLLPLGGRYVCVTGCANDAHGRRSPAVARIDRHYICGVHSRGDYFQALAAHGLAPVEVVDLTPQAVPYWELRARSPVRTGIEETFLTAYAEGAFQYLLIAADRV
ncbi:geranyl diphosphate 2-C-methyltransferase [Streptomyces griseocarneus]|uniref:geranyl diphosphate 2-C-methyltransferase n=1 Tax=Streptomyces griseocarneus TaxID=51201 RepID=UPI00167C5539|nr:geranyl diphosphate 2-C-methyltransferase [Streptomyces griseocarneus]MBZ6474286.1 methyltransferase domain-containing protein [Streptomyces griseocarneus]GHG53092.1 methyltransferase [Streptomyces griseocarneus]